MTTTTTVPVPVRLPVDDLAAAPAKALNALQAAVDKGSIEQPLLQLVRLRASQINGCGYCVDMHSREAIDEGDTARRIFAVAVWREAPFFTERERAALELTEAVTRLADNPLSDELYDRAKAPFSDQEMADLIFAIATINVWNRLGATAHPWPLD
ncbi:carboxymuconolactone decarboxylase family protein [Acidothermaceae bacterium B102]|nr:carboxymuconolactone decarboxylase family protein [Acidothermaceae bacterium B102]